MEQTIPVTLGGYSQGQVHGLIVIRGRVKPAFFATKGSGLNNLLFNPPWSPAATSYEKLAVSFWY